MVVHKQATKENPGTYVCGRCHDVAEEPIASKCKHVFCREDIRQYMESYLLVGASAECPVCFTKLNINLDQEPLPPKTYEDVKEKPTSIVERMLSAAKGKTRVDEDGEGEGGSEIPAWSSSTKIEALLEELTKLRMMDRTIKSIVFSQFVSFLDLVALWIRGSLLT